MKKISLSPEDRSFFSLVSKAAFINPFSKQRFELDLEIIGDKRRRPWRFVVPDVIKEVSGRISQLDKNGVVRVSDFEPADQKTAQDLFLFDVFHCFKDHFDEHIVRQSFRTDELLGVDFADDAIGMLKRRGFTHDTSVRFFSMFFQIRRAFYFIDRGLIGQSDAMRRLRCDLWNNIFTHDIAFYEQYLWDKMEDFSTLMLGPTGSGKGAAAAAIGRSGFIPYDVKKGRFAENFMAAFIPINLSQYPETLLESELFGHTKGSFTGAIAAHEGLFALCSSHGTVFLDEIGDVSEQVQIKLLRVLQERVFSPVGSHTNLKFHGRVIAATNKSIDDLRREGQFRDDFYYRMCSDTIVMPSLRERLDDDLGELDELINHTVGRIVGQNSPSLAETVREVIDTKLGKDYHWPGNVRELEQCVRRIIIKRDYTPQHLKAAENEGPFETNPTAADLLAQYCRYLYDKHASYEKVARITDLDRRTVKKYIDN
jgi:hypothetical protein